MHSVADLLKPEFDLSWHEAVAIVQEVASQLPTGMGVPSPEDVNIEQNGAVVVGFAAETGDNPVVGLAHLLKALLKSPGTPRALATLAADNASGRPTYGTVDGFTQALTFYERPGRENDLAAIGTRLYGNSVPKPHNGAGSEKIAELSAARPARIVPPDHVVDDVRDAIERLMQQETNSPAPVNLPEREPDRVLEELREKVAAAHETAPAEDKKKQRWRRYVPVAALAFGAAFAVSLVAYLALREPGEGTASSVIDRVEQKIADVVSGGLNRLGGGVRAAEAPANTDSAAARPSKPGSRSARSDRRAQHAGKASDHSAGQPSGTGGGGPANLLMPASTAEPSDDVVASEPHDIATVGTAGVYTAADARVTPPVIVRPQLPRLPSPDDRTGYFEVVINEAGEVETVRLHSPTRRYHDRMLVAAAKAWRFRPAMLDGHPVRFMARIPIILPEQN